MRYAYPFLLIFLLFLSVVPVSAVVADAGPDQIVVEGELVILNGSNSNGGNITSYNWTEGTFVLGAGVSFSSVLVPGIHNIVLEVVDDGNATDTDSIKIIVNSPPVADAGNNKVSNENTGVILDAGNSYDEVGGIVSYEWSEGSTVISTSIKFSKTFSKGVHTITLKVTDKYGVFDVDAITVSITQPPIADAGPDIQVYNDTWVTLNGSNSMDPDGYIISYKWMEGTEIYNTAESFKKLFQMGVHVLTLTVTDNNGAIATDTVTVEVLELQKDLPVADAGPDIVVNASDTVMLNASGSYDLDGNITDYLWSEGEVVLSNNISFEMVFDIGGHTIVLDVTDNDGSKGNDALTVTVIAPNIPPIADAGSDINVPYNSYVDLDAFGSTDPDGEVLQYEWRENGNILSTNKSFHEKLDVGVHYIELIVTDDAAETSSDSVIVTVYSPTTQAGNDQNGVSFALILIIAVLFLVFSGIVIRVIGKNENDTTKGSPSGDAGDNSFVMSHDRQTKPEMYGRSALGSRLKSTVEPTMEPTLESVLGSSDQNIVNSNTITGTDAKKDRSVPVKDTIASTSLPTKKVERSTKITVTINVTDQTSDMGVEGAKVSIDSKVYETDRDGNVVLNVIDTEALTIDVRARYYDAQTSTFAPSKMIRINLNPLPLISSQQERGMSDIRKHIDESYRSIMTYDHCISSFYRGIVQSHINFVKSLSISRLSRSEYNADEIIDIFIATIGMVGDSISHLMTSKRNIDIYSASKTSLECTVSDINTEKIDRLLCDPAGYYASEYRVVQRRLLDVDSQITLMSNKMSVMPLSGLLKIAREMLDRDSNVQLERSIYLFIADNILNYIVEMYTNEHIVNRLGSGVL